MTVCIAAACVHEKKPAIVLCCDWQGTKGLTIKSDDVNKLRVMGKGVGMIAGTLTDADELVAECEEAIRVFGNDATGESFDLDMNKYLTALRKAAEKRKAAKVKHHVAMSLGMSLEDFWKNGKQYLSAAQHDEIYAEIRGLDLDASLIISSVTANEPVMVKVDRLGRVSWENNFSTIGSGGSIAEAFLHQYDWEQEVSFSSCLFRVFSAKLAAEKNPQVGPTTSFEILFGEGRFDLTDDGWKRLKRIAAPKKEPAVLFGMGDLEPVKEDAED